MLGEKWKITVCGAFDFLRIPAAPRSRKHQKVATDTKIKIQLISDPNVTKCENP